MKQFLKNVRKRWHGDIAGWNAELKEEIIGEITRCTEKLEYAQKYAGGGIKQECHADSVYEQLSRIYNALQDDLSRKIFMGRIEYSITHVLTGVYRAMLCDENVRWRTTKKTTYAEEYYGLPALWELLKENYPVQKHEIYLLGFDDPWNEYNWVVERFFQALPGLGIKVSGCVMPTQIPQMREFQGFPCISEKKFLENINENTRIIIGFPGWMREQLKDVVERYIEYKDILFPIADTIRPQYIEPELFRLTEDEIFVDVGVFDLQDSINFAKWARQKYKKIYAFEPDPKCYQRSIKRLGEMDHVFRDKMELINKGLGTENSILEFPAEYKWSGAKVEKTISVEVISLDSFLDGRPVTFVKMDVEGAEMSVLAGMRWTILRYKPKLAVCIYHKHEDVFEISSFLLDLVPEYKFYLRHYNSNEIEEVLFCTV